jgi:hypothetical protein
MSNKQRIPYREVRGIGLLLTMLAASVCAQTAPPTRAPPHFPPGAIWNQDISAATPDVNSSTMLTSSVGWGTGGVGGTSFQIDFSMHTLYTSWAGFTTQPLVEEPGYYTGDCDSGYSIPLPNVGAIEGETDYTCPDGGDCHLFIVHGSTLFESFSTFVDANGVNALCMVKWHLNLVYPTNGRGDRCSSADAAGFPMAPLIATPNDVWNAIPANGGSGDLGHALRFILPNNRIRPGFYVHPASHSGVPSGSGSSSAIPYGARLRLRASFDITGYNAAAQVVLKSLKTYGMFLSDGGGIPLTFDDGMFTNKQWSDADIGIDSHSLFGVSLGDFDVMPIGTPIVYSGNNTDCVLNPDDVIFADGNEW